jgi:hypothetical protein
VSLRYDGGRPLGVRLAALVPDEASMAAGDSQPGFAAGLEAELKTTTDATHYLRINDSASKLADNLGTIDVGSTLVDKAQGVVL